MTDTSNDQHPLPTESHQPPQQDTSEDMTILGHLTELRKRILYSLLAVDRKSTRLNSSHH